MYKLIGGGNQKKRSLGLKNARKILRNFNFEAVYTCNWQEKGERRV